MSTKQREALAYIVGAALGDGNLSNPNGRAIRLRITCDTKYPFIIKEITDTLRLLFPRNQVSHVHVPNKPRVLNISVYSNSLNTLMPWAAGAGPKFVQKACVPGWIKGNLLYSMSCLRGLLQTDGSIYLDRGYVMLNFVNRAEILARDVFEMMVKLGYEPTMSVIVERSKPKYTVRLARKSKQFIEHINLRKE